MSTHTERGLFLSRHSQMSAVFPHENVCQPSSLQSKLRSIRTRLSRLQTVIDGQESRRALDKMSKLHRSRLDTSFCTRRSGSSQLASDETLSRTACPGTDVTLQTNTERGSVVRDMPFAYTTFLRHTARITSVSTPSSPSVQEAHETNVTPERQRLHSKSGEGHDCRSRGTEASKEEGSTTTHDRVQHHVQFWSGVQCDDQLKGTQIHREISKPPTPRVLPDDSSLAPLCPEHPSVATDRVCDG